MALSNVTDLLANLPIAVKVMGGTVVTGTMLTVVWRRLQGRQTKSKIYPPNTIVIHQIGRGPHVPSLTPFAIKLETYFRMEGIPYEVEHNWHRRAKQTEKTPFIEYNGEEIPDSEFILEFLSKEKNVDLNKGLTPEQVGIGRAFQKMMEENTYCYLLRRAQRKKLWTHGIGRYSPEQVRHIMSEDLKALSRYLGSKKFLFGDKASKFDCAIFGILAEIRWASFGGFGPIVIKEYPNLCDYCDRMKETFWPDWDTVIKPDNKK